MHSCFCSCLSTKNNYTVMPCHFNFLNLQDARKNIILPLSSVVQFYMCHARQAQKIILFAFSTSYSPITCYIVYQYCI